MTNDKIFVPDFIPLSYNIVVFKDNGNIELYERMSYTTPRDLQILCSL